MVHFEIYWNRKDGRTTYHCRRNAFKKSWLLRYGVADKSLSSILCKSFSFLGNPASKFNGKAIEGRLPVVNRHRPLLGDILDGQVDHLKGRLIGRKNPMSARHGCRKDMLTDSMALVV